MADSATLTVTDTGGHPDPVSGIARVFTVSGTAAVAERVFARYRPAGGAACAPTASTDSGQDVGGYYSGRSVNGSFSFSDAHTWSSAGTYLFCIWLAASDSTVTSPISQVITFRSPTGTISASINPLIPRPGQQAQVTVTGASEAPRSVFAKVRPASTSCAPTYDSDIGEAIINGYDVNGAFSQPGTTTQAKPGNYVICLWLASSSSDAAPVAGPQAVPFSVVQPPPKTELASVLNCRTQRHVGSVRPRFVSSVCLRYRFSVVPLQGQTLTVTFITPAHRTYKRVSAAWPDQSDPTIIIGSLGSRGYKHRPGLWQAVLRVAGKELNRTSFRVR